MPPIASVAMSPAYTSSCPAQVIQKHLVANIAIICEGRPCRVQHTSRLKRIFRDVISATGE